METVELKSDYFHIRELLVNTFERSYSVFTNDSEFDQIFYVLTKKFINHINTFGYIMGGTNFNDLMFGSDHIDHPSAKIILRSSFENYVTVSHLFWDKPELAPFRVDLYKYSGLKNRQKFRNSLGVLSHDIESRIAREKSRLNNLRQKITSDASRLNISKSFLNESFNNGWRGRRGWPELAKRSTLQDKYIEQVYSYLSGYTHSGYESYMQLVTDEGCTLEERYERQGSLYFMATYLMAKFCIGYTSYAINKGFLGECDIGSTIKILNKYELIYS